MKKILTAVIIALTLGAACANAESNESKHFEVTKSSQNLGGVVGNTAVYIYPGNKLNRLTTELQLKMLTNYTKKIICSKESSRKLVTDYGIRVLYIYPTKDFKTATMVSVTNCDGFPAKK